MVHEVAKPPFVVDMDTLDVGMVYYADVALKDADGYLSERSQVLRIERPIGKIVILVLLIFINISLVNIIHRFGFIYKSMHMVKCFFFFNKWLI